MDGMQVKRLRYDYQHSKFRYHPTQTNSYYKSLDPYFYNLVLKYIT